MVEDITARILAMEERVGEAGGDPRLDEVLYRLTALEQTGVPASDSRVMELSARLSSLEKSLPGGKLADSRVDELLDRLEALEETRGEGPDPRIGEVLARLDNVESDSREWSSTAGVDALAERVATLESQNGGAAGTAAVEPLIDEVRSQVAALEERLPRLEQNISEAHTHAVQPGQLEQMSGEIRRQIAELEERLAQIQQTAQRDSEILGKLNPDRLVQWTRETQDEIGELREQVAQLREFGTGTAEGGSGISLGAIQALGDRISEGMKNLSGSTREMKALRNQMYFVYFTIGMIYAVGAFAAFVYLLNS
jgi:polyhydroxyalkanoate synthesis regulator phasin